MQSKEKDLLYAHFCDHREPRPAVVFRSVAIRAHPRKDFVLLNHRIKRPRLDRSAMLHLHEDAVPPRRREPIRKLHCVR